jgi:hypothetical protein
MCDHHPSHLFYLQVKALKAQRRAGLTAASLVGDFADEVADLVDAAGEEAGVTLMCDPV